MLTLLLDANGRGIGRGDASGVPGYSLGANEVRATAAQYADPAAWMLRDGALVPAPPATEAPALPVPSISRAQAKIQLMREGLLDEVKQLVAAAGPEAQLWFDEAGTWSPTNPYVLQIAGALGLDEARRQALFRSAAKIEA